MSKKKTDNVLALPPLKSETGSGTGTSLLLRTTRDATNRLEKRIIEESHTQDLVIDLRAEQARFAMTMIGRIHEHGSITFSEATEMIMDVKDNVDRSQEHQAYIDQFSLRQIQLLAQETLAMIDVVATTIGGEVHRSPDDLSREPVGLLARLLTDRR